MNWIVARMKWIMLISGALTCTMLYAALQPQAALRSNFGDTLEGPVAEIVVRNWGALIALVGGMLIYGAFHVPSRPMALVVAGLSKIIFIGLLLTSGRQFLHKASVPLVVDSVMVILFGCYLLARPRGGST